MELLRAKDNEIEVLRKKLREKKEKAHRLRRQLIDIKERLGVPLYSSASPTHATNITSQAEDNNNNSSLITEEEIQNQVLRTDPDLIKTHNSENNVQ
jgi:cell shape-determining protein MreC